MLADDGGRVPLAVSTTQYPPGMEAARKVRKPRARTSPAAPRTRRRTGAGQAWNPDNIVAFWVEVALLLAAVVAAGVGSIDGLLHYAALLVSPELQWVLPVAVDVFLVGTALATLSLRRRRAYGAVIFCSAVTLVLVAFSATCNYLQIVATSDLSTGDPAALAAPWVKAAMPILLLAAVEIVAALTSTRNNREASPLNRTRADLKKAKAEIRRLRATTTKAAD